MAFAGIYKVLVSDLQIGAKLVCYIMLHVGADILASSVRGRDLAPFTMVTIVLSEVQLF